jgi:pyruvate/2-oxoglutarate/acetoin dehydrogenase E1 component
MLARAKAAVSEAVGFCTAETDGKLFIPDSHWPPPQDLVRDVRCEDDAFDDVRFVEKADFDQFSEMSYVEAISAATLRNMQKDEKVFVLGEEVANLHGGAYRATRGIKEVFPEGLDVEVVDLRTLDYSGLDFDTIGQSVEKTGLVLILEQVPRSMGIASRISDEIQERFYDFLDAPVEKITAPDVPAPVSRALETAMLPNIELIKQRLRAVGKA